MTKPDDFFLVPILPLRPPMTEAIEQVLAYHEATKHHVNAYAPSPGFLDWDSQPNPFRRYSGAPLVELPLEAGTGLAQFDALPRNEPAPWTLPHLGLFLELSLGLSRWKTAGPDRWALRNNPSSGNLHPTEGYLLIWRALGPQLSPGLYHYAPHEHALERRATFPARVAQALHDAHPCTWGAVGLSSIVWREEWKYGSRAFRYCQHDVGHAFGSARYAAAVLGWTLDIDPEVDDGSIEACLGLHPSRTDAEPEHPDLLALLGDAPPSSRPDWTHVASLLTHWCGSPNRLSAERVRWPQVQKVLPATRKAAGQPDSTSSMCRRSSAPASDPRPTNLDATTLIRGRRSAQRMDGKSRLTRAAFERILAQTMPSQRIPFDGFPYEPALNLLIFVHAVDDLTPGLYALERTSFGDIERGERYAPDGALPLYLSRPGDHRRTASHLSCHQGIAGRGAFSLAMMTNLSLQLQRGGAWSYRRLHWEAGLIGQVLYLEAEAVGLRGTGIGCFFDNAVAELVEGLRGWHPLYHFTIGGPIDDRRLGNEPAYAHLGRRAMALKTEQ